MTSLSRAQFDYLYPSAYERNTFYGRSEAEADRLARAEVYAYLSDVIDGFVQ